MGKEDIDLADDFEDMLEGENEDLQVVKELFTEEALAMKTDLDNREIRGLSQIAFMYERYEIPALKTWAHEFMKLRVSRNRKGRAEFIEAVRRKVTSPFGFGGGGLMGGFKGRQL